LARERIWTAGFTATFATHFILSLGFWSFVHLPGFLEGLGARETQIGLIVGTLSVSAIVNRPWIGRLMDLRGRRPVLLAGSALNVVAVSLYLTIDSLGPWIYAVRVIHGISEAALFSVVFTIAADLVPASRRTEGIAVFGISGLLPLSLGGVMGDWILERWDYQMLFSVGAILGFIAFVLALPIRESRPASDGESESTEFVALLLQRSLLPLWLMTLGFTIGLTSYFTFLKTYIGELQVGSVGLFFLAYSIASVVLRVFFAWLPERLGPKRALVPSLLALVAGLLLLAHAESSAMIVISGVMCGMGHAYAFPILSALVVNRAGPRDRGVAMTLFTSLFDAGILLGAPLLGAFVEASGYTVMYTVAAMGVVAFTCAFYAVDRPNSSRLFE
jgi:predicted MFS family arabinose efflux permease